MNRLALVVIAITTLFTACGSVETSSSSCSGSTCTYTRNGATVQGVGGACSNDGDCAGSMRCDTSAPGGYCFQQGCSASSDCPTGGVCSIGSPNVCIKRCTNSSDCRAGYRCVLFSNSNNGWCGY